MGKFKVGNTVRLNGKKLSARMKKLLRNWYYLFGEELVFTVKGVYKGPVHGLAVDNCLIVRGDWLEALEEG